ncbi:MAG: hypothetical protein Q7S61_04670 [bacterium]|nr:hypothetical protein [bacterium]
MHIAVLQISHDHIQHTKIGMKLMTQLWKTEPLLQNIDIFHAYNGLHDLYPTPYLEKKIIRRENLGHYDGAADLMDAGVAEILSSSKKYDYILVMSGDVWLIKPDVIAHILQIMESKKYLLTATLWPNTFFLPTFFGTEFFIISTDLARNIFPLKLAYFFKSRLVDTFFSHLFKSLPVLTVPKVEICFTHKVLSELKTTFWSFGWKKSVYLLPGREVFFGSNRYYSPKLGYLSHHDMNEKMKLTEQNQQVKKIISS